MPSDLASATELVVTVEQAIMSTVSVLRPHELKLIELYGEGAVRLDQLDLEVLGRHGRKLELLVRCPHQPGVHRREAADGLERAGWRVIADQKLKLLEVVG